MKALTYTLRRLGGFIAQFFKVFVFLKKDPAQQPLLKRVRLFLLYLKFTWKDIFLTRFLKKKIERETFLNYTIHFSRYSSFRNLFVELFILQQYYFKAEKKDPYIIDCGANIGMSVLFFKFLYPNSQILAFEPDADSFSLLAENVRNNKLSDITIYNVALLDKEGEIPFYTNKSNNSVNTVVGEIFNKEELVIKKVRSTILSSFINRQIDFLKIDVEGSEDIIISELVKKGVVRLVKNMVIEYHPYLCKGIKTVGDFVYFLKDNQFDCNIVGHQKNYLMYAHNNQ